MEKESSKLVDEFNDRGRPGVIVIKGGGKNGETSNFPRLHTKKFFWNRVLYRLYFRASGVGSSNYFIPKVDVTFKIIDADGLVVRNFFSYCTVVSICLHVPL